MDDAPRSSSATESATPSAGPSDEPEIKGTLFIMLLFMMALVGFWVLMYLRLLEV